ncbi:hypothetical protein B0A81_15480 [Flavobacterium plurextorum]|uniref:Lipocalin-like domain-containing protein n=1 Tax=Flavobacterium plurextorum TaxID=1114867 RepID=A0ABX4CR99_9FLAO|nr:hypothetical protein [Flavobacterium plurextorum]OXB05106.1 hypothetical protein B0A81_15480 [Flavobacterium plurextorum]
MNKLKIIITFFVLLCISCSKKSEIESIFITSENEYWAYRDYCWNSKGNYYKYNKNGTCDKFALYTHEGFVLYNNDGDDEFIGSSWSIKNDSTFVFNYEEYKIEKISNQEILLSYYHYKIKDKKCFVRLTKWVNGPEGPKPLDSVKGKE